MEEVASWQAGYSLYENGTVQDESFLRWLAETKKKEEEPLDYSVLSVGVMTLGLILCVEVLRHRLDHIAEYKPFFKVVLEATYSELATLGLVELFVFLLLRYYELQNKERKDIFAEVHFALFYTAIFNAFQSVLCAFVTRRASSKLWVQTEQLELDHYVEIREEFDRVSDEYHQVSSSRRGSRIRNFFASTTRSPGLRRRYLELLVQVRFHQLRLHFLEGNNLPLTLKVSDYLKRAELKVLMEMVHVHGEAWLMLTGGFYFLMGVIANKTENPELIGNILTTMFFSLLVLFIVICTAIYIKMTSIFREILEMDHARKGSESEKSSAQRQKDLFWLGNPQLVISLVQFMQFGYAMQLSIVIMFWSDLGEVNPIYYLLATLLCYSTFVFVLGRVLPQYTLCTSLGSLVDKKHLQETVAMHRLMEAQRRQKRKQIQLTFDTDSLVCMDDEVIETSKSSENGPGTALASSSSDKTSWNDPTLSNGVESQVTVTSHGDFSSGDSHVLATMDSDDIVESLRFEPESDNSKLLAELVKMDTAELRQQLPASSQTRLKSREQRMRDRKMNRKKAVSDGVQAMRNMGQTLGKLTQMNQSSTSSLNASALPEPQSPKSPEGRRAARRANRKKALSSSATIQSWQNMTKEGEHNKKGNLFRLNRARDDMDVDAGEGRGRRRKSSSASEVIQNWQELDTKPAPLQAEEGPKFYLKEEREKDLPEDPAELHRRLRAERRANRKKAVSASAVIQSWQDYSVGPKHDSASGLDFFNGDNSLPVQPAEDHRESTNRSNSMLEDIGEESHFFSDDDHEPQHPEHNGRHHTDEGDSPKTLVNLSDAKLVAEDDDVPKTKKSVGFSTVTSDDGSLILPGKVRDDESTVDTGKSVGELSDVADAARNDFETLRSGLHWEETWFEKLQRQLSANAVKAYLHDYFVGPLYPVFSHVFGSVVVFFLIGMRVEAINSETGAFDSSENTWELKLESSFWWQATWYCLFICTNILAMWSVNPSECKSVTERRLFSAAVIDLSIAIACLTLLFVAEAQRCCDSEAYELEGPGRRLWRLLAGEDETGYSELEDVDPYVPCCPFFGSRTYGGLGNIEPFTALIGLRTFRYVAARFIVNRFWKTGSDKKEGDSSDGTEENPNSEEHDHSHDHGHGHGKGAMHNEKGTALELWEQAISKYPNIVEKYGQFSGELFQAMLGLEIDDDDDPRSRAQSVASLKNAVSPSSSIDGRTNDEIGDANEEIALPHYKLAGDQYASLSAESQCIIMAGKLGKPVKSMANLLEHIDSSSNLPTLHEESTAEGESSPDKRRGGTQLEFEIDAKLLEAEEKADSIFFAPNARLVRSMRRCDRRLYPLLKEWVTVDVVMTDYEIVYFEVQGEEEASVDAETLAKKNALKLAMQATKGGKGLRLVDVAAGRKVVGHLDLADVTQLHVERDMPLLDVSHLEANDTPEVIRSEFPSEYWQKQSYVESHTHSRAVRWAKIKEDRLKLVSIHGTLVLRYYSDLNDIEAHLEESMHEDETSGPLKKNIALQWAQTIAHMCGTEQLKQRLPNFGLRSDDELRDYLEVVHHNQRTDESRASRRRGSMLASVSMRNLTDRSSDDRSRSPMRRMLSRPSLKHSQSLGESSSGADGSTSLRNISKALFKRSSSMGSEKVEKRQMSDILSGAVQDGDEEDNDKVDDTLMV